MRTFISVLTLFFAVSLHAADWPQYRGPNADGIAPETGINKEWKAKPPRELWRIKLGDNGFAGPIVAAGKLFIVDKVGDEDLVRAVDLATGKDVWTFKYPDAYKPDMEDWGRGRSTPTFEKGRLYTQGTLGMVHAFDAEKGAKIWSKDIKAEYKGVPGDWAYTAAPLVDGDKLILCPGGANASVVALDKNTGKEIWKGGGSDKAGYATPVLATLGGKKQYVVFAGTSLIGVDPENGALLWSQPWKTSYDVNAAAPVVMGNEIFISSGYGKGCALIAIEESKPRVVWQNKIIKAHFNPPILHKGHLVGITGQAASRGELYCLDPKTGATTWRVGDFEVGGVVGVDGLVIACSGISGEVVLGNPEPAAFQELGRITPLGGRTWTAPIIADGKLFVRNMKELVCLDLK